MLLLFLNIVFSLCTFISMKIWKFYFNCFYLSTFSQTDFIIIRLIVTKKKPVVSSISSPCKLILKKHTHIADREFIIIGRSSHQGTITGNQFEFAKCQLIVTIDFFGKALNIVAGDLVANSCVMCLNGN